MKSHFDLTDEEFEKAFEKCNLAPGLFNHEAHLRLTWIHLNKYGLEKALVNIETQLKNYVAHAGATDKYHQTLTLAAVKVVYHFMRKGAKADFPSFIAEHPKLKYEFKKLINYHYSYDVFQSEQAKKTYQKPDLHPII